MKFNVRYELTDEIEAERIRQPQSPFPKEPRPNQKREFVSRSVG
jgi:hypothetical protein